MLDYNFKLAGVYRPPHTDIVCFCEMLDNILEDNKKTIFFGDFNINLLNNNDLSVQLYIDTLMSNNYLYINEKTNNMHTRCGFTSVKTIIDHVLTDILQFKFKVVLNDVDISDHRAIITYIDLDRKIENKCIETKQKYIN
jgi:endonuclease/exonuclease/phosphatase family metal-dependent hydrolase